MKENPILSLSNPKPHKIRIKPINKEFIINVGQSRFTDMSIGEFKLIKSGYKHLQAFLNDQDGEEIKIVDGENLNEYYQGKRDLNDGYDADSDTLINKTIEDINANCYSNDKSVDKSESFVDDDSGEISLEELTEKDNKINEEEEVTELLQQSVIQSTEVPIVELDQDLSDTESTGEDVIKELQSNEDQIDDIIQEDVIEEEIVEKTVEETVEKTVEETVEKPKNNKKSNKKNKKR